MKVYSETLTMADLHSACPDGIELMDGAVLIDKRSRRFEGVRLCSPVARKISKRRPNTGTWGADRAHYCATWDEHGAWMAELFERDPSARIMGYADYRDREDFHQQTGGMYAHPVYTAS